MIGGMNTDGTDSYQAHDTSGSAGPADGLTGSNTYSLAGEPGYGLLERPVHGRMIAGVAAGIADYLGVEVILVRIALIVLTLVAGIGLPVYLAGWLLMPDAECGWSVADDLLQHVGRR
jgi:phage shock protein PspC (stress-responsive transcriptional regulator)